MRFFNQVPESFEDNLAHIDDLGGPSSYNHYAWGWAWAGDTPFRRWKRETYRGGSTDPFILAGGGDSRRAVRSARQDATPSTWSRPCSTRSAITPRRSFAGVPPDRPGGRQLRAHVRRRAGSGAAPDAVLREVRSPRDLPRRLARRVPVARAELHHGGGAGWQVGQAITPEILDQARPHELGALRAQGDPTESANVAAEQPQTSCATWSPARVGRKPSSTRRPPGLRLDAHPPRDAAAARRPKPRAPASLDHPGRLRIVPRLRRADDLQPGRTRSRPTSTSRPGARRGCWSRRAATPAATSLYVKDGQLCFLYNYVGLDHFEVQGGNGSGFTRVWHALRFEFEPTGAADIASGKGVPVRRRLYVDGELVGAYRIPAHDAAAARARGARTAATTSAVPGVGGGPRAGPVHRDDPSGGCRPRRRADRRRRGRPPRPDGEVVAMRSLRDRGGP